MNDDPLASHGSPAEIGIDDILKRCGATIALFKRGADICTSTTRLHILQSGWACKYKLLSRGQRQVISLHLSDAVCDLDRLFVPEPSFGVQALTECRVAQVPIAALRAEIDRNSSLRDFLWDMTVKENIAMVEMVTVLGKRSARERTAWLFCEFETQLKARDMLLDRSFRLELRQADLADFLGMSLVHVNRTLQEMKSDGLIANQGSVYTILDGRRLRALADLTELYS